jgi:phosphatidylglycerol:prolipoprotein diacylglycerol transferase
MPSPPDPVAVSLFGVEIRWYALFFLAGVIAAILLTRYLATMLGLDPDWVLDATPWIVVAAIVGARTYYVALRLDYFSSHPWEAVNIRLGGLSFHGALVAGLMTFVVLCRAQCQSILRWSDAAMPGIALAQSIGRWGNWANQEAFGSPTSLPWGLVIDAAHRPAEFANSVRFHPTFLYESLFDLVNAVILAWIALKIPASRMLRHGDVLGVYLINYGIGRFLIERLRVDSLYIGPLPAAYWLSWGLILAGLAMLIVPRLLGRATAPTISSGRD